MTVELREAGGELVLRGYASTTETWYPIGYGQQEKIVRGAFRRTLGESPDVALRVEHSNLPLARSTSKTGKPTLTLSEDNRGLLAVAQLNPNDRDAQDLRAKAEHTDLQMSFAFRCNRDRWDEGMERREVLEVNLHRGDVAICAYGANEDTEVAISERSASTLEQRRAVAERLSGRVNGPRAFAHLLSGRAASETCARCGGRGVIDCPDCAEPDEPDRAARDLRDFEAFAQRHLEELRTGSVLPDETITRARRLPQARDGQDAELARRRRERRRVLDLGRR